MDVFQEKLSALYFHVAVAFYDLCELFFEMVSILANLFSFGVICSVDYLRSCI